MHLPIILALMVPLGGLDAQQSEHWFDGEAELAGYRLTQPRYGESRAGEAVLIYVTETFSESMRTKADPGQHPESDQFGVMKLNLVKHFQTGIYDYDLMTSVFSTLRPRYGRSAGTLTKLTFSAQEWCGQTFDELLFDDDGLRHRGFSYFDGEGDRDRRLDFEEHGIVLDRLFIAVRGIPEPLVRRGETLEVPIFDRLETSRLHHRPAAWREGSIRRLEAPTTVTVPGGTFEVDVYDVRIGHRRYRFDVETTFPHRLIRWQGPGGEVAELTGVTRMKYWKRNGEGDEALKSKLGLEPTDD